MIARYVADAPLETLTDCYVSGAGALDIAALAAKNAHLEADLRTLAADLAAQAEDMRREEQDLRLLVERAFPAGARRGAPFVVSKAAPAPRAHIPASRFYPELGVLEWKARCGWAFGLAPHTLAAQVPGGVRLCGTCARGAAAGPHEPDTSDSEA